MAIFGGFHLPSENERERAFVVAAFAKGAYALAPDQADGVVDHAIHLFAHGFGSISFAKTLNEIEGCPATMTRSTPTSGMR